MEFQYSVHGRRKMSQGTRQACRNHARILSEKGGRFTVRRGDETIATFEKGVEIVIKHEYSCDCGCMECAYIVMHVAKDGSIVEKTYVHIDMDGNVKEETIAG